MSNPTLVVEQTCDTAVPCEAVELLIRPREHDIGGFSVRRALPTRERRMVGPWIFFDHMGPARFPAGRGIDVRPHPHISLATVTYLFEGEILHRDSLGNLQPIRPGDINLMVAGHGITHSERETAQTRNRPHALHGLQLWLALPEKYEETAPAFYHYPSERIPRVTVDGVDVRVMMGRAYGETSPVKTFAETLYLEAALPAGQSITLPETEERAVYVVGGHLETAGTGIAEHALAVCTPGAEITLTATQPSRIVIIGGENIGRRHIEWNFVSSRRERIDAARALWKAGGFPKVRGDEQEFIPLPE
ncbi:MAG TPA: pirin family protein [Gammaproteobacteria bacterium]|nr:pirin family protein [Gammaproteobacteria bacterium]